MLQILLEIMLAGVGLCGDRLLFWLARHAWYFYKSELLFRQLARASDVEELWELNRVTESFRSQRGAIIHLLQQYESFVAVQESPELRFYDEQERVEQVSEATFNAALLLLRSVNEYPYLRAQMRELAERMPDIWQQWYQCPLPSDAFDCLHETERLLELATAKCDR